MNQDSEFIRQTTASLDRSLDDVDDKTLEALSAARCVALNSTTKRRRYKVPAAIAASVFALALIPSLHYFSPASQVSQDTRYLLEDPEFLLTMDVLIAMEVGGID